MSYILCDCCVPYLSVCVGVFVPTSDNGCGWGVMWFTAALLQSEGVELQLSSIQQLLGLLL